jgi:hypothetical protein
MVNDTMYIALDNGNKVTLIQEGKSKNFIFGYSNKSELGTFFYVDSLGNLDHYFRRDSISYLEFATYFKNNIPDQKLKMVAFLDKEFYSIGDSATLTLRAVNRLYPNLMAKVYFPYSDSVFDSREYPEIFSKMDRRNADSVDVNTLKYKFKVEKSPKDSIVIRMFCYRPEYSKCLFYQKTVGDIPIHIK